MAQDSFPIPREIKDKIKGKYPSVAAMRDHDRNTPASLIQAGNGVALQCVLSAANTSVTAKIIKSTRETRSCILQILS
jgi:hypothetical protein